MRRAGGMNPTLRGFLIILAIATAIFLLQLETTLITLSLLLQIIFFIAIAIVLYMFWRDRLRMEIETWETRPQVVFYGSFALILVDLGAFFWPGRTTRGLDALSFVSVLLLAGFSMYRVWRDQRAYRY
jgi:hypothetical protein